MVVAESAEFSLNGKSRVSREAQARFREGLGVQLPGATRPTTDQRSVSVVGTQLRVRIGRRAGQLLQVRGLGVELTVRK